MGHAERTAALAEAVAIELAAAGHPGEVEDLRRLSGGASRETWALSLRQGEKDVPLILQQTRAGTVGNAPMTVEADLLRAASRAGVPVPGVVAAAPGSGALGASWMLVGQVEGESIARRILRDDAYAAARQHLVAQAAESLAAIHSIPTGAVTELRDDDPLAAMRALVDGLGAPHPAFELAFRWLEAHRPPAPATSAVVHGDFRLGNLVVDASGLVAVLDWELAHRGDPVEDLGWFCVRAWRFGLPEPVAGLGSYEELVAAYEAAGGRPVDREVLRWWEVLGTLRWGAICMLQASVHLSGASPSVELAAIGRRTCEAEYDLGLLLEGTLPPATATLAPVAGAQGDRGTDSEPHEARGGGTDTPHDRPTAAELLDAVRTYLATDVAEATEGRVAFHARVAANVVGIVARQLSLGPAQARAHAARLRALGMTDDAQLAAAIRSGAIDADAPELRAAVWAAVADKVAVANPDYAAPTPA